MLFRSCTAAAAARELESLIAHRQIEEAEFTLVTIAMRSIFLVVNRWGLGTLDRLVITLRVGVRS